MSNDALPAVLQVEEISQGRYRVEHPAEDPEARNVVFSGRQTDSPAKRTRRSPRSVGGSARQTPMSKGAPGEMQFSKTIFRARRPSPSPGHPRDLSSHPYSDVVRKRGL